MNKCSNVIQAMKKTIVILILLTMSVFGYSQDWFRFNDYKADNERIINNKAFPEVVFMGNSITENWAYFHPEFFTEHNYLGRGIGGQTSAHMLVRFQSDVIDLHPRAVVIMAGTNDVAHNDFWDCHVLACPSQWYHPDRQLHPTLQSIRLETGDQGCSPNHR